MIKKGDRIRLTQPIVNKDSYRMPIEEGMPVGLQGTVADVRYGYGDLYIEMNWDNGRTLALLGTDDCYEVLSSPNCLNLPHVQ